jgi:ribosomal protein L40E
MSTDQQWSFVEKNLGDRVICMTCGATYKTMNRSCNTPLLEKCPGYLAVDEAISLFKRLN